MLPMPSSNAYAGMFQRPQQGFMAPQAGGNNPLNHPLGAFAPGMMPPGQQQMPTFGSQPPQAILPGQGMPGMPGAPVAPIARPGLPVATQQYPVSNFLAQQMYGARQ